LWYNHGFYKKQLFLIFNYFKFLNYFDVLISQVNFKK
jgi:hypothetical protein